MNIFYQPQTPDSASSRSSSINPASRIDIVLSYGDMASPAYSDGSPSAYYPADVDMDAASPAQLTAHAASVGSPASMPSPSSFQAQGASASVSASAGTLTAASSSAKNTVCAICRKSFARPCDLNRHKKTHDRPFKCTFDTCPYKTRGFPTDQERKRHVNDRHADSPPTYACSIDGCSYYSKRESNLKQHKEKTHDWKYDRSRPTRGPGARNSSNSSPSTSYLIQTPVLGMSQPFAGDYGLSVDPQLDAANAFAMSGPMVTGSATVTAAATPVPAQIAWEEPATEHQLGHYMMSTEGQITYADPNQHQQGHMLAHGWISHGNELMPPIYTPLVPSTPNATPASYLENYAYGAAVPGVPYGAAHPMVSSTSFANLPMQAPVDDPQTIQNVSSLTPLASATLASQSHNQPTIQSQSAHTGRVSRRGSRPASPYNQTFSNDLNENNENSENKMSCPFHVTDSVFYNRTNHERYSPCHTEHRYISTLLAAHNLVVDENSASSFGIDVPLRPQPQAGLCRRCWHVFYDRPVFEQHTTVHAGQCHRSTHSKQEKYNIIRQTFCNPPNGSVPVHSSQPSSQPPSSPSGSSSSPRSATVLASVDATPGMQSSTTGPDNIDIDPGLNMEYDAGLTNA